MELSDTEKAIIHSNKIVCPGCDRKGNKLCEFCAKAEWIHKASLRKCTSCSQNLIFGESMINEDSCSSCSKKYYYFCENCDLYICETCC